MNYYICSKALVLVFFIFILIANLHCENITSSKRYNELDKKVKLLLNNTSVLSKHHKLDSLFQKGDGVLKGIVLLQKMNVDKDLELDSIIILGEEALEYFNETKCYKGHGYASFKLGNIYYTIDNKEKFIFYFKNAISDFISSEFFDGVIICHFKLATYYSKQKIIPLAKIHFEQAQEFFSKTNNNNVKINTLLNYATLLSDIAETDSALMLYQRIEREFTKEITPAKRARLYNNIATSYLRKEDFNKAQSYFEKSLSLKQELKDSIGQITTTQNLFSLSLIKKDELSAKNYYDVLMDNFRGKKGNDKLFVDFLYNEINYHVLFGDIDIVPNLIDNYMRSYQQFYNKDFSDKLVEMQKSFEIKERDKNIALLQKEDELKEARLSNQLIVIISIGAVLLLLIVLGYFINKQRVKLKQSESHLKKQQKRIKQINTDLKTSNLAKDRILSIIGHDLRGPIGGLKELIELYMDMPGYEEEDFKSLLKAAREASTGSYYLLENLLTWANSQNGQIDFKPLTAPLLPLAKNSIDLLDSSINTRNVSFKYDISPAIKLTADLNMLRTIIRNLVSNAVKYSPPESCITISATQNEQETFICIADQGYGMTAEQSSALFEKKETYFIEAGYNAKGSGLGLVLCREFVEQHKGKIWADSVPNQGTKVCFTIPLNIEQPKTTSALHKHTPAMN